jgi:hypothetical protein
MAQAVRDRRAELPYSRVGPAPSPARVPRPGARPTRPIQEKVMSDYASDIAKYTANVNAGAVEAIVKYCGIALQSQDASLVSTTDPQEIARVRDGFATKKLGLSAEAADAGIKAVTEKMKADRTKSRVTFYYLLAEATGTMGKLA